MHFLNTETAMNFPHNIAQSSHALPPCEQLPTGRAAFRGSLPGLLAVFVLAAVAYSMAASTFAKDFGFGVLTLAMLLGLAVAQGLSSRVLESTKAGINFAKQDILRWGVILYGLRLSVADLVQVGPGVIALDVGIVVSTVLLGIWLGTRIFKLDRNLAILIGAGSGICGAAAVMATAPVLRARHDHSAIAVACVVIFGTLSMLVYPVAFRVLDGFAPTMSAAHFGIYIGSTLHEVAQVLAAARDLGAEVSDRAVIVKLARVLLLVPFLFGLLAWQARRTPTFGERHERGASERVVIPWFALGFLSMVGLNSLVTIPKDIQHAVMQLDNAFLALAMAALGLTIRWADLRGSGAKPLLLAAMLWIWLIVGGGLLNIWLV